MQIFPPILKGISCLCLCLLDLQQLIELGPELTKHCAANESPFVAKVGEPCCVMLPGKTIMGLFH